MDKEIAKREENIKKVFSKLNKSGQSHLSLEDVTEIFGGVDQAKEIFDYLDADGDGQISLQDFQKAVENSFVDTEDDSEDGGEFGSDEEFGYDG
jgi:Ca2+-binding EF-hand superfamily protein